MPILLAMSGGQSTIEGVTVEAGRLDKTLADAKARAQGLAQQTHDKLHAEAEAKRHALEDELNGKLSAAEKQIGATRDRAMSSVAGIARDTAAAIVQHITGAAPSDEALTRAVGPASAQ